MLHKGLVLKGKRPLDDVMAERFFFFVFFFHDMSAFNFVWY